MKKPSIPANEEERLHVLEQLQILDTPEETFYSTFTQLASEICGAGISTLTFVDRDRQWFKSRIGMPFRETARETSFCGHVVASGETMVIEDTHLDERFADNPLVVGEPFIRFYVGIPLTTHEGLTVGTLCIADSQPRTVDERQINTLHLLARGLMSSLEAQRRFLPLFDAARIDLFSIEAKSRRILFASRGSAKRLGYSVQELTELEFGALLSHEARKEFDAHLRAVRENGSAVRSTELLRRDGSMYPVELRLNVLYDRGEEHIVAIASDRTESAAAQREIDLWIRAINVAGNVILVYRVVDDGSDIELAYMNDAYTLQTGYTREESVGQRLAFFRKSMPDDEGMHRLREAFATGKPTDAEIISYRKDGTAFWNQVTIHPIVDNAGTVTHWIAVERDITEEVNRTAALAEEHDRLLALTRAARRIFTALDGRELVIAVREVLRGLTGGDSRVLVIDADNSAAEAHELGVMDRPASFHEALVTKAIVERTRVVDERRRRTVIPSGNFGGYEYALELTAHSNASLSRTDLFVLDLVAEYFAVAARNVTLYYELDERRSSVLELNQTKSDLITMLAHDFRGPLTSIVGFAELTREVGSVTDEQSEFLDTIKRSAMSLSELATDTLTLSRLERNEVALQLGDVDLGDLLRGIIAQYADRCDVALRVDGDVHIAGDEERLRQVFSNVIDNAIKYSPQGPPPDIHVEADGERVIIRIRDHGIGIPHSEISRVFDRFSRASNARRLHISGTGFGLFLANQLVQLHGGTIAVESVEGSGSTFAITLPRPIAQRVIPKTLAILDQDRDRSFLAFGLRDAGYRVVTAGALDELFGIVDAQSIDAAIVVLPHPELKTGGAVQLRAFSRERTLPIIAIANEAAPRLGAAVTLRRPVLIGDVTAALERLERTA